MQLYQNRLLFQSSTVNNATSIGAIPNGTSSYANFTAFASSNPDQSALIQIAASSTEVIINSTRTGAASYLPLAFYTGGVRRLTMTEAGLNQFYFSGTQWGGIVTQATDASASNLRSLLFNLNNENNVEVGSYRVYANTDGSSTLGFGTTPAGARNSYRIVENWVIDGTGRMRNTGNSMPRFHVKRTTTATLDTSVMFHPTASGTVCYNTGSGYNTSTGDFTAPVAGLYQFCYDVKVVNSGAGTINVTFGISQTGSTYPVGKQSQYQNNGETLYYNGSACIYLAAGDVVKVNNLSGVLSASLTWEGAFQGALLY